MLLVALFPSSLANELFKLDESSLSLRGSRFVSDYPAGKYYMGLSYLATLILISIRLLIIYSRLE